MSFAFLWRGNVKVLIQHDLFLSMLLLWAMVLGKTEEIVVEG
jgi:hypothetical protein